MTTILTATITVLVSLALAALSNNAYKASHLFSSEFFGSKSDKISILKYGSASICLLISFLCSYMAIGFLIDANFLMNSYGKFLSGGYTQNILEKGYTLAFVGNRVFCVSIPLMLWMLGPVLVFLSSIALVCLLHELDFVSNFPHSHKQCTTLKGKQMTCTSKVWGAVTLVLDCIQIVNLIFEYWFSSHISFSKGLLTISLVLELAYKFGCLKI